MCFHKLADVSIGFQSLQFFAMEGVSSTATVCAQIMNGTLEREVVAYLSTLDGGTAESNKSLLLAST